MIKAGLYKNQRSRFSSTSCETKVRQIMGMRKGENVTVLKCLDQQGSKGTKLFHHHNEMKFVAFTFIAMLTFGLMMQKQ